LKVNSIVNVASRNYATPNNPMNFVDVKDQGVETKEYRPFAYQTHPNMVFRAKNDVARLIAKAPLEDKISTMLPDLVGHRMLVIAKNLEVAQKYLKDFSKVMASPLEHIFLMKDSRIDEALGILREGMFEFKLVNLGDKDIAMAEDELSAKSYIGATFGDSFVLGNEIVSLKPISETKGLEEHKDKFVQDFDFTEKAREAYMKMNQMSINTMIPQKVERKKGVSFADVGGQDKVIDALYENIVFPIQNPEAFQNFKTNKGVLLYGPPGTGKSLIAEALANEVNASYFKVAGTEFAAKYVGESEKNVRELIEKAIDAQPSIIFIDEVDALGRSRGGHDQYGDTLLNQFLKSMTDLNGHEVYCLAATNRLESLDEAFTRSGRFGEWIKVDAPDLDGTIQILGIHTKGKPLDENLDKVELAKEMNSLKMTGADIAVTVADAHRNAYRRSGIFKAMRDKTYSPMMLSYFSITKEDFDKAIREFKSKSKSDRKPIGFGK